MPMYISTAGQWFPQKERFINANADDVNDAVYEGPDRAAVEVLEKGGVKYLGKSYLMDPDLIRRSRELGFKTVDEFLLTMYGVDMKEQEKKSKEALETIVWNSNKSNVQLKKPVRVDSGGEDLKGGFGDPTDVPSTALNSRA